MWRESLRIGAGRRKKIRQKTEELRVKNGGATLCVADFYTSRFARCLSCFADII